MRFSSNSIKGRYSAFLLRQWKSPVRCQAFIHGLCATGRASARHLHRALAEPVAHIKIRLTEHSVPERFLPPIAFDFIRFSNLSPEFSPARLRRSEVESHVAFSLPAFRPTLPTCHWTLMTRLSHLLHRPARRCAGLCG